MGWILCRSFGEIRVDRGRFYKYPELRFIDRFHALPAISLGLLLYFIGAFLNTNYPQLGTSGCVGHGVFSWYGFGLHVTFCVNSVTRG